MRTFIRRAILTIMIAVAVAIGLFSYPHIKNTPWIDDPTAVASWAAFLSLVAMVSIASICQIGLERFAGMVKTRQINTATVSTLFTVIGAIASVIGAWAAIRG